MESVRHALHELRKVIEKEGIKSLAVPKLGTGAGGLAWADVRPVVADGLASLPVPTFLYAEYQPGVKATEA